ncbi:MAG: EAL domain-containing protein, partial [Sulfuricella sp.]
MTSALLQELESKQARECVQQLQHALAHHNQWLNRLYETLICRLHHQADDVADAPHLLCQFGQWYHKVEDPVLRNHPTFIALGKIHQHLHHAARSLLLESAKNRTVSYGLYTSFLHELNRFRQAIFGHYLPLPLMRHDHWSEEVTSLANKLFEYTTEGVMISDTSGSILNVNSAFSHITGYSLKDVVGRKTNILKSDRQNADFYRLMWQSLRDTGHWEGEIWNRRKNGEIYLEWLSISAVRNDDGNVTHYVAIFSDITTARENELHLQHLAYYDPLTNLPNRMLLQDRLNQAIVMAGRERRKLAILFIDLDRFGSVNEMVGHKAGDALLVEIAQRLRDCVRSSDTVARMCGDEFTVLLPDIPDTQAAGLVAEKIIDALALPYSTEKQPYKISPSIGIAIYPNSASTAEGLLKTADVAMYHAKSTGRNTYQYYRASVGEGATDLFAMESSLRAAIEKNELEVMYQPQVSLTTGTITGTEALVRWHHPERGLVMPSDFIPLAEETGLIVPLGEWVMRRACTQNVEWQKDGFAPMRIAVNLSARQLRIRTLAEKVAQILDETGLDPAWLELELTETMVMRGTNDVIGIMQQLKSLGVCFSIDDFGTGYSSLSYLKRFPINAIKIDRSFVQGVPHDFDDATISKAIIGLGHSL